MGLEIEFKWEANAPRAFMRCQRALARAGANLDPSNTLPICDVYLDHPTRDFEKQKLAFRVRQIDDRWEATFKTRAELKNGRAVRREETCALPGVATLTQALAYLHAKKTWKGINLQNLYPLFTIYNKRRVWPINWRGMQAEVAFDTCQIHVCGRRVFFKEIELELKKGAASMLEELAAQLSQHMQLPLARVSKVKTALGLLQLWGKK